MLFKKKHSKLLEKYLITEVKNIYAKKSFRRYRWRNFLASKKTKKTTVMQNNNNLRESQ